MYVINLKILFNFQVFYEERHCQILKGQIFHSKAGRYYHTLNRYRSWFVQHLIKV